MSETMKRLCDAAKAADPDQDGDLVITAYAAECIVRAVLAALPNLDGGPRYAAGEWSRRNAEAMVADVLGE